MPTARELPDPFSFSERLRRVMAARGYGGRGGAQQLAIEYGVKPPVVSAWLNGRHLPAPAKVRRMAREWRVPEQWFYWGEGQAPDLASAPKLAKDDSRESASATLKGVRIDDIGELQIICGAIVNALAVSQPDAAEAVAAALRNPDIPKAFRRPKGPIEELLSGLNAVQASSKRTGTSRR